MKVALAARRAALGGLGHVSAEAAAIYAERLFTTPRRHGRPAWETAALADAVRTTVAHDGASLPLWTWGEARSPAALLVHGWEGRGSQLAAFVAPLVDLGLRVVAFDAPGHGDAASPRDDVVRHAAAVRAVADTAGNVRLVVAHSMGGAATLLATRFGLRAGAYALVAPPTSPRGYVDGFCHAYGVPEPVRAAMLRRLARRHGVGYSELDALPDARALDAPLLVVHDEADRDVPLEDGRRIAEASKDARLVTTRGLGHRRILRAPEVLAAVEAFAAAFAAPWPARSRRPWGATSLAASIDAELYFREDRREATG
jgi:pimeloyl-ACP methyl ester carboxylesterase